MILLVAGIAGFFIWRKCAARRAMRAQEFEAASYFSNNKCVQPLVRLTFCLCRRQSAIRGAPSQSPSGCCPTADSESLSLCRSVGSKVSGAFGSLSAGASGLLARFRKEPPQVITSTPSMDGTSGLMKNPATPFSQIGEFHTVVVLHGASSLRCRRH